ncbi:LysR family transcriptional regulator [Anaerorhabdus furcosa]|uniref:DNA-binding transcriptional regulator, LysR family n=1 Tax=Anaerorhabdus furcosa TaxID=118967 RepID=A0A1T4L521_9FIRM|nr:LysR family transcriptional regulator [Anaerorhabdus furcosa]SJZ49826.1 DNA-binding transcriptional regulator, LysR family [Anaerorhabdus furcosa]
MNIKLEQYKIFNEAATTLSFSEAARNLFITQSAVSQAISLLEKELQTQLFVRMRKGVTLTKEGELLYQNINQALNLITNAENQLSNLSELQEGELVLAAGDSVSEFFLTPYLSKFHDLYPNVTIKVVNRTSIEIYELLKNGQVDLGFVNLPIHDDSLSFNECFLIHDIFVGKNPTDKIYTYKELSKLPLILLEESSNSRNFLNKQFAKNGIKLNPQMELGAHSLLLECVKERLGVACVIKEFSSRYLNTEVFELNVQPPLPTRSIGYAYLTRKSLSAPSIKFIELIKQ